MGAVEWVASVVNKEMESLLRSATVALAMGDASVASKFLRQSMSARERHRGPLEVSAATLRKGPVEFHAEAREIYTWRRRAFEAELLPGVLRLGRYVRFRPAIMHRFLASYEVDCHADIHGSKVSTVFLKKERTGTLHCYGLRKIVIFGEGTRPQVSSSLLNVAYTGLSFSRAEQDKLVRCRRGVAPTGKLYWFKVVVVLGSQPEARWEEGLFSFLS